MHRTSQQMFAGLVLAWMQDYATYPVDDRNKCSVAYITRLLETFAEKYPEEPLRNRFPLI
ncbi:hypothetical protein IR083_07715 [Dysgonomonas sp. GY75]|uniref:hypothetical protein n=1 Tax=Dysgonomonas sp. GY75 TaxID=2780419 RepID=UPI001883D309|nr:hypothetical protein [Dysgonomonas sp. GY75]MBF0648704.1 hypothetical protein [Dysgonomonas sp. GY75]